MNDLLLTRATIVTPMGTKAACGADMGRLTVIPDGTIAVRGGVIVYAGPASGAPDMPGTEALDLGGRVVLPGFVDSHTHLIFGGFRPDEFGWRLKGDTYMSIMERGGGIQSTVDATRRASADELYRRARWFLGRMARMGVTTVEAKSGYGLDTPSELKMLQVIRRLSDDPERPVDVVSTFLGAHAVPREYKGRTAEYTDLIIREMLPQFRSLAENCDVFCERGVFELDDSRRLLRAAADLGYGIKLHADEIVTLGGAELAAELGALSADHLLHISDRGIADMARAGVVATLLPLTAFALKEPYAPARRLIDAGCAVALATDLNPGSCFSGSIPLTIALACIYMNMTVEETITALTLNGAAALGRARSAGTIEPGKKADLAILGSDNYHVLPYYVGMNCVMATVKDGKFTHNELNL